MTGLALALVLSSAGLHATWNYLSKRIGGGGAAFMWLFSAVAAVIYCPLALAVIVTQRPIIGLPQIAAVGGSALINILYFVLLSRGYQAGDLSLVYPLARGTGPMLSTLAAVALLGERPTPLALLGALLVGLGVIVLTGDPRKFRQSGAGMAVIYALLTGVTIATYTIVDKQGVSALAIPPLLFDWSTSIARTALLTPYALRYSDTIRFQWQNHRREVIGVAILSPLSYILMLTALSFSPVSYVAPAREISILIGTLIGARVLQEGQARRRLIAAVIMVAGVIALALG